MVEHGKENKINLREEELDKPASKPPKEQVISNQSQWGTCHKAKESGEQHNTPSKGRNPTREEAKESQSLKSIYKKQPRVDQQQEYNKFKCNLDKYTLRHMWLCHKEIAHRTRNQTIPKNKMRPPTQFHRRPNHTDYDGDAIKPMRRE